MQMSAIKGRGLTLPSVDGFNGTLNIKRDPPKSVFTRYKPKITDTSLLTDMIDNSGDRVCENIKPYARGINPMVSVSYSNYGTNGGQVRGGGRTSVDQLSVPNGGGKQAFYPYRVNRDGAFRPPIIPPEKLLPLSRLPKLPNAFQTNAGSNAVTATLNCNTDLKALRQELLKVCAPSRSTFNMATTASKPNEVDTMIRHNLNHYVATSNPSSSVQYDGRLDRKVDKGVKHATYASMKVNPYSNIHGTPLSGFSGNQPMPVVQYSKNYSINSNISGVDKEHLQHQKTLRSRKLPYMDISTNKGDRTVDLNNSLNSRNIILPPISKRDGFSNNGYTPVF